MTTRTDLPRFECSLVGQDDTLCPIFAVDEQQAAEDFVCNWEWRACEFTVASGQRTVRVRVNGRVFEVSGEAVPSYRARPLSAQEQEA